MLVFGKRTSNVAGRAGRIEIISLPRRSPLPRRHAFRPHGRVERALRLVYLAGDRELRTKISNSQLQYTTRLYKMEIPIFFSRLIGQKVDQLMLLTAIS